MVPLRMAALARSPWCLVCIAVAILSLPGLLRAQPAQQPTFDCHAARLPSELRICLSPDLASLDIELAKAYAAQRAALPGADDGRLRLAQRDFLRQRDRCQGDEPCLHAVMLGRLTQLQAGVAVTRGAPVAVAHGNTPPLAIAPAPPADARQQRMQLFQERAAQLQQEREERAGARQRSRSPEEVREALIQRVGGDQDRPPPLDATPAGDEWRGVYECGGADSFLRVVLPQPPGSSDKAGAVIEFGPAPGGAGPRGSFTAAGTAPAAAGPFRLDPLAWIHRPEGVPGTISTFGLDGQRETDGRLVGTVAGGSDCKGFRAWHIVRATLAENPEGLLFHVPINASIPDTLSLDDCRRYAAWLLTGRDLRIAGFNVSSLFYDTAGQQRVLGRTVDTWRTDDYQRMNNLGGACKRQLGQSAALGDADLVRQVHSYAPDPFLQPPSNWLTTNWGQAEVALLLWREAQDRAAARLARLAALPPTLASFQAIDQETSALQGTVKDLVYLEEGDRAQYKKAVAAQRVALSHAIVADMVRGFGALPPVTDSLLTMKTVAHSTADGLRRAKAPDAAHDAEAAYAGAAAAKATTIWPVFLDSAIAQLGRLAAESYHRFPAIIALHAQEQTLTDAAPPPDSGRFSAYRAAAAATVDAMVSRSMPGLTAWAAALPTSAAANKKLADFTGNSFGGGSVPDRFAALSAAVTAKLAAYNPEHYRRPDIVMSLSRHMWAEVPTEGLEDISFFATALHRLDEHCRGIMPPEGSAASNALAGYLLDASFRATQRIMSGKVQNQAEAQRFTLLALNQVFNRPGCRVSASGAVTSCTTPEEQNQVQQAILTSTDAGSDMDTLAAHGCTSDPVRGYVDASIDFAAHHAGATTGIVLPDAWAAVADN